MLIFAFSSSAFGYEGLPVDQEEQMCYARAMVGMDSVINSRLGVPPEHALSLAEVKVNSTLPPQYSKDMLKTILAAYLWEKSPHSYAVKVFYHCAGAQQSPLHSARNDWLTGD